MAGKKNPKQPAKKKGQAARQEEEKKEKDVKPEVSSVSSMEEAEVPRVPQQQDQSPPQSIQQDQPSSDSSSLGRFVFPPPGGVNIPSSSVETPAETPIESPEGSAQSEIEVQSANPILQGGSSTPLRHMSEEEKVEEPVNPEEEKEPSEGNKSRSHMGLSQANSAHWKNILNKVSPPEPTNFNSLEGINAYKRLTVKILGEQHGFSGKQLNDFVEGVLNGEERMYREPQFVTPDTKVLAELGVKMRELQAQTNLAGVTRQLPRYVSRLNMVDEFKERILGLRSPIDQQKDHQRQIDLFNQIIPPVPPIPLPSQERREISDYHKQFKRRPLNRHVPVHNIPAFDQTQGQFSGMLKSVGKRKQRSIFDEAVEAGIHKRVRTS